MEPVDRTGGSLRAGGTRKCRDVWRCRTKGRTPGTHSGARGEKGHTDFPLLPTPCASRRQHFFLVKPLAYRQGTFGCCFSSSNAPLTVSTSHFPGTASCKVPERIPDKPGARETPCGKRRRISVSIFIYSEKISFY